MSKKKYTSRNYAKALELIIPYTYINEDISLSGQGIDLVDQVLNSHLNIAANIGNILFVSSTANLANMSNVSGIAPYFVKQNNITDINSYDFENKIMYPLGYRMDDYSSSAEFESFLSGTLLPKIRLNDPFLNLNTSDASSYWGTNADSSSAHEFLADTLGWFYFLNTSADGGLGFDPSSYVSNSLAQSIYFGKSLKTVDGIKGLTNFLWKNYTTCSVFSDNKVIPAAFLSGTGTYTSGTQQLDKLETLIDIAYSPELFEKDDERIREVFDYFISSGVATTSSLEPIGPFYRFIKALGFSIGELQQNTEKLNFIYNINDCPDEYLQELAELIGWKLFGYDPSRWRLQLRQAVEIYKATGTKHALQLAINSIFADETFDLSGSVSELYESYVPNLIYYALATYSPAFTGRKTWTSEVTSKLKIPEYYTNNFDDNIKNYVDHILLDLVQTNPSNFMFSGTSFPISKIINSENGKIFCGVPQQLKYKDYRFISEDPGLEYNNLLLDGALPFTGPDGLGVYLLGKNSYVDEGCDPAIENIYLEYFEQNPNFVFNYRQHKRFPIPPFEEILYYKDTKITQELVNRLLDRLGCAGVSQEGLDAVSDYILNNSLKATDDIRSNNNFLLFTSSLQTPPNFQEVLSSSSIVSKSEYLSLWSGKSSHFRIFFDATDFNFLDKTQTKDSAFALLDGARIAKKFSPAHAIPLIDAFVSSIDSFVVSSNSSDSFLNYKQNDASLDSCGAYMRYATCAVDSRALFPAVNFKRKDADSVYDSLVSSITGITTVPRNTYRRRDYKNLLPKDGVYFRDGKSMPINFDASTAENSWASSLGFLPLGYIPSAGIFYPINDYIRDIRGPYDFCETLESTNTFSGVVTASTFPCRGLDSPATASGAHLNVGSNYVTRDTLPDVYAVFHKLGETKRNNAAKYYVSANFDASSTEFFKTHYWKNNVLSYSNSSTQLSGAFPNSEEDYSRFTFGLGLHKLYKYYTNVFRRHSLGLPELDSDGGPTVLSHAFGPLVYNGKFNIDGSACGPTLLTSSLINADTDNVFLVDLLSEIYSGASGILGPVAANEGLPEGVAGASGTYIVSSYQHLIVPLVGQAEPLSSLTLSGAEFRNKHLLSGVEFIGTSGAASSNNFQIYNLDSSNYNRYKGNYAINNTIIKLKAIDGLPRIRFDLAKSYSLSGIYSPPYVSRGPRSSEASCSEADRLDVDYFSSVSNFLIPDHEFNIKINALTGRESKPTFGESKFSVWVHTGVDSDGFYYYWNKDSWTKFDARKITRKEVIQVQSIMFTPETTYPKEIISCYNDIVTSKYLVNNPKVMLDIEDYHFDTYEINFNTHNGKVCGKDIHTYDQEYYIEIFINPSLGEGKDTFLLLDKVSVVDSTLHNLARIIPDLKVLDPCPDVSAIPTDLCSEDIRKLFIFFNKVAAISKGNGLATRIASDSSAVYNTSGGSRISYRENPYWLDLVADLEYYQVSSITLEN